MNPVIPRFFRRALLVCIALLALAYVSDYLYLQFRLISKVGQTPFETVTVYSATNIKGGKVEIFSERPEEEICVRSLFPHLGHDPCWYLNRSQIQLIRRIVPEDAGEDALLAPPHRL